MVRPEAPTCCRFRYAQGFGTRALAQTLDSLVRVSRRVACRHYASALARRRGPRPRQGASDPGLQHPRRGRVPGALTRPPKPALARPPESTPPREEAEPRRPRSDRMRFPHNDFTYCFTLFSKCFSPFDYSTCALSVSGRYLALDGIYHPLRAAFSNNSTLRRGFTRRGRPPRHGALTLCGVPSQGTRGGCLAEASSADYNSGPR